MEGIINISRVSRVSRVVSVSSTHRKMSGDCVANPTNPSENPFLTRLIETGESQNG